MKIDRSGAINGAVYSIGAIWGASILVRTLLGDVSRADLLQCVQDLSEVAITLGVYWAVDQIRRPKSFSKAAETALKQLQARFKDLTRFGASKAAGPDGSERYLFVTGKREAAFIPLEPLRRGILEIRVSYGTLDNLGISLSPKDIDKEEKIAAARSRVREEIVSFLKGQFGESHYTIEKSAGKDVSIRVSFAEVRVTPEQFRRVVCDTGRMAIETVAAGNTSVTGSEGGLRTRPGPEHEGT